MKKLFPLAQVLFLVVVFAVLIVAFGERDGAKVLEPRTGESKKDVLSHTIEAPQIYISGGDSDFASGGVIPLASTDEPAVSIGGYKISGDAEIKVYEANQQAVMEYLLHDDKGQQLREQPNVSAFRYITTINKNLTYSDSDYEGTKVPLPLGEKGVWYLKVKIGKKDANAFIVRSNIGAIAKEGDAEFIFWGQNFKTRRSISEGKVTVYSMLNNASELSSTTFSSEGIAKANLTADADIAVVEQQDERAIIPINLRYLNSGRNYQEFQSKRKLTRHFIFTDRPLYKPGDTVNFKTVLRDDDDARYTVPTGQALVKIDQGYESNDPLLQKNFPISQDGTISGEYQLPTTAKVGYYTLSVQVAGQSNQNNFFDYEATTNYISFDVQYFKKPEFTIDVTVPKAEIIAGENTSFTISGQYFSGQPLAGEKVRYTVYSADYYDYEYLSDYKNYTQSLTDEYRYGNWYSEDKVKQGTVTLNERGIAEVDLPTKLPNNKGKNQVFSIEATIDDGSEEPSFSRRNMLVYSGDYGIFRRDAVYGAKVNTVLSLPIVLDAHRSTGKVDGVTLTAKVKREDWVSFQEKDKKYPSYRKEEENLSVLKATTDTKGNATFSFTPKKTGSYVITVDGKDNKGNKIEKVFYSYVYADDQPFYNSEGHNNVTIAADKQHYQPNDTARLSLFSQIADRDVFLSMERGRVSRYQVVHINGRNATVEMPLENTDIPNIYAKVSTFSNAYLDESQINLPISAESKKIAVAITPDSKTYGPGETVTVNVNTTDVSGNPVSADLALWAVDKSIFELSDNRLGNIFKTFWDERYNSTREANSLEGILVNQAEGGGCFAKGTKILMSDGSLKNIEDITVGEYILTRTEKDATLMKARVQKTHKADASGYLIVNGHLKITANHILWVNSTWKEAGSIQIGDTITEKSGKQVAVQSIEWQRGTFTVYNLEIEKYHTYFADNIWVHNEKGIERSSLKDTAYWNPSIHTDASGRAKINFTLPDNLTTWTLAAVAATADTKVGQTTEEIVVTKDVIVRPILPNILRTGDTIVLSALVQNFTDQDQTFDVALQFNAGDIENASRPSKKIKAKETKQLFWKVRPKKQMDKSKLVFSARSTTDKKAADVLTQEIPVRAFGFSERRAETGEGDKTFTVKLAKDSSLQKSKVILSLAPTLTGTLPTAMSYLIDYPYGCVEQTTSRFVPAVIAKTNSDIFASSYADKDINDILQKSVSRLSSLQRDDGGWTWWYEGRSDAFITAYVIEYLLEAKKLGIKVDETMMYNAQFYLERVEEDTANEDIIAKTYALTLLNSPKAKKRLTDFTDLGPDLLAMAVMANYRNGDTNPKTNGLDKLVSLARPQGDGVFWGAGEKVNFGTNDASTAFAIRAIVLAKGDRDFAAKAARYLTRSRKNDYWSNTFATAQVMRALVDLSKTGSELTPNYSYRVMLDQKEIARGSVTNAKQVVKEIAISLTDSLKNGAKLAVTKTGSGQMYSTVLINEFHTDKNAKAEDNGLRVERKYVNEKGEQYSLAVGETVLVELTVSGLKAEENYGVIQDELPSGMVPINENFKNQQYGEDRNDYYYDSYDVTDREVTENGIVLSLYQIQEGSRTYTYRARVISEGTFTVPPATAALMYAPEVHGRSSVQTATTSKEVSVRPGYAAKKEIEKYLNSKTLRVGVVAFIVLIVIIIAMKRRGYTVASVREKIKKTLKRKAPPDLEKNEQ